MLPFVRFSLCLLGIQISVLSGFAQHLQYPFTYNDSTWYNRKKGITAQLIEIMEGDPRKALAVARAQGTDAEADFIQSLAYAQLNIPDSTVFLVLEAGQKRLPMARYYVSGAPYLEALQQIPVMQSLMTASPTLIHGPMLGNVKEDAASVWLRTQGAQRVWVEWSSNGQLTDSQRAEGHTSSESGFTTTLIMNNLLPGTQYHYRIGVQGDDTSDIFSFTTPPTNRNGGRFEVLFGGGAAYIPWHHHMWSVMASHRADALFMLGDNVYIDYPEKPYVQQYCYHRRQSEAHWRRLVAETPVYAIWDDHDFGDNDEYGGPAPDSPAWKLEVLELFKQQWVNPGYGGEEELPGVFFKHQIGNVDFFFLDGRYYRQPSFVGKEYDKPLSMLGTAQKDWLKRSLKASKAQFKVIISPVPWSYAAKPVMEGRIDTWGDIRRNGPNYLISLPKIRSKACFSSQQTDTDLIYGL